MKKILVANYIQNSIEYWLYAEKEAYLESLPEWAKPVPKLKRVKTSRESA